MLRLTIFAALLASVFACIFDSDCPGLQICSGFSGFCYDQPSLHQFCMRDSHCRLFDIWSECRLSTCQCLVGKYERNGGCWSTPDYSPVTLIATLVPVSVFVLVAIFLFIMHRRRNATLQRIMVSASRPFTRQPVQTPMFATNHSQHTFAPPPPPYDSNPYQRLQQPPPVSQGVNYSQSQGIPKF